MTRVAPNCRSSVVVVTSRGLAVEVVSQRIGDVDVRVTLRVYAQVLPGDDEDAALRADSLLAP